MKKLTIGSAVYDDPQGIWYTYQSLRLNNNDILQDLEFIVIDNNPSSKEGRATKEVCRKFGAKYIPYTKKTTTACRNEIFSNATGLFTMSLDSHVLLEPDTIKKFIAYTEDNPETEDLLQGPMLHDSLGVGAMETHMKPEWRDDMFGIWSKDARGFNPDNEPFEIPMHGLGAFACKTDAWLKFFPLFKGFGGEEGYIHEKFRNAGRKTLCLPFFRWLHRFRVQESVTYPLKIEDRVRNYALGHLDNGKDVEEVRNYFLQHRPNMEVDEMVNQAIDIYEAYIDSPALIEEMLEEDTAKSNINVGGRAWGGGNFIIPSCSDYLKIEVRGIFPIGLHEIYYMQGTKKKFLQLEDRDFGQGMSLKNEEESLVFNTTECKGQSIHLHVSPDTSQSSQNIEHLIFSTSPTKKNWTELYGIDT